MSWTITPQQRFTPAALLDRFPGAAAAYSLRNLVGTSNPSVVRVRRSSDSAEQDFTATQVTDGTLTTFCGAGNGFVRTWYDQSGNAKHATQASTASQPQLVSSGAIIVRNSKPTLLMNSSELFISSSLLSSQLFTLYTVVSSSNTAAGEREIISNWNVPDQSIFLGTSGSTIRFTDRKLNAGAFGATNTLKALDGYNGSAFHNLYVNNSLSTTGGGFSGLTTNTNWYIGVQGTFNGKEYWSGNISEIIIYPSDQSSNRTAIAANINMHYILY
jgi:hypothetical protein